MSFWKNLQYLRFTRKQNAQFARKLSRCVPTAEADVASLFRLLTPRRIDLPFIRVGGDHDGGYLMPDDLDGLQASFSPGVFETITFDLELAERGVSCFLADASVDGVNTDHPRIHFDKLFLGAQTGDEFISLADWVDRYAPNSTELLLQIDIEGAEYECLNACPDEVLERFRIIVIEFHDIDLAFDADRQAPIRATLEKLERHFHLCHLHANNVRPAITYRGRTFPRFLEATYIRKDRCAVVPGTPQFPHPLDQTNCPDSPDFAVRPFW